MRNYHDEISLVSPPIINSGAIDVVQFSPSIFIEQLLELPLLLADVGFPEKTV
jgi:hypothetical protein